MFVSWVNTCMQIRFTKTLADARDSFIAGKSYEVPTERALQFLNEGVAETVADFGGITKATLKFTVNPIEVATVDSIKQQPRKRKTQ